MADALLQAVDFESPRLLAVFPLALLFREVSFRLGDRCFAGRQCFFTSLSFRVFRIQRLFPALLRQGQFVQFLL